MNEPNEMPTEQWLAAANAAIAAIRRTGATNLILVPGNGFSSAASWSRSHYGTPNARVMTGVVDPGNNWAYEVHQYLDDNNSGKAFTCVSETIGSERLRAFTDWLRGRRQRAFLGEFAGGPNDVCHRALADMLAFIARNEDQWIGWTYWAAGPRWGDYAFSIEPEGGADKPQMAVLQRFLATP
jgi:endoglucanase